MGLGALLTLAVCALLVCMAFIAAWRERPPTEAYSAFLKTPHGPEPGVRIRAESAQDAVDLLVRLRP